MINVVNVNFCDYIHVYNSLDYSLVVGDFILKSDSLYINTACYFSRIKELIGVRIRGSRTDVI